MTISVVTWGTGNVGKYALRKTALKNNMEVA